jgi:hypothetical protein
LNAPSNTGGQPDITPQWGHYFGTLTADIFDNQTLYDAGELTIVPEVWLGGQDYVQYNIVTSPDNSTFYVALQTVSGSNTDPSLDPTNWQAWVQPENQTFGPDGPLFPDYVTFTDLNGGPLIYISLQGNNGPQSSTDVIGLPATQPLAWTNIPGCSLEQLRIIWPTDAGPANDPQTQNVFWLPFGFLRPCAADPKADRVTWLGAPTGPYPNDYVFEGQYMLSRSPYPITLRFVADIADVTRMNPLFCKTVAMNMAELMSTPLKASEAQMARIERQKRLAVREAREIDAIFQEAVAPELDDYITSRY